MNPTAYDKQSLKRLQDLLSINIDSQRGLETAAEAAEDPQLQSLFRDFSQRRAQNASELRMCITSAGEEPTDSGSVSGTIHRWWIDAKQTVVGKDSASILNEAERGEDSIKHEYESALQDLRDLPARDIVEQQYRNVKEGHDRVRDLRDSYNRNPRG